MDGSDIITTALISDDDEFFRIALSKLLIDNMGFRDVIKTASFDEALERLNAGGPIALALFDLAMPGIDSPLALRTVRETFSVERVAVVSGSRRRVDILKALEAGVHGYIPKWLGVRELQHALETVVSGTIYVPSSLADLDGETAFRDSGMPDRRQEESAPQLTPRQKEVLALLVDGQSTKEIARTLDLGLGTVKVHLAGLFRTLGVANRAAAAAAGVRLLQTTSPETE